MSPAEEAIDRLRAHVAYFDKLVGPDGDCGESCAFVPVNDVRAIVRAFDAIKQVPA